MVNISIDVTDLGGEARPGDKVVLWKPAAAGSSSHAGRVISTAPVDVFLTNGKASVPDVEPGEMRVLLQCRGVESQGPIDVTVPDGNGTVTLRSLIESQFEYAPPIVSAVQEAAANASASERAAIEAQIRSEAAADRADAKVDDAINNGAELVRDEVKQDADRAVSARQAATQSESNAAASEDAAASSATNAATSETNAKQSETNAGDYAAVATTAATEAVDAMETVSDKANVSYVDAADQALGQRINNEKWRRGRLNPVNLESLDDAPEGYGYVATTANATAYGLPEDMRGALVIETYKSDGWGVTFQKATAYTQYQARIAIRVFSGGRWFDWKRVDSESLRTELDQKADSGTVAAALSSKADSSELVTISDSVGALESKLDTVESTPRAGTKIVPLALTAPGGSNNVLTQDSGAVRIVRSWAHNPYRVRVHISNKNPANRTFRDNIGASLQLISAQADGTIEGTTSLGYITIPGEGEWVSGWVDVPNPESDWVGINAAWNGQTGKSQQLLQGGGWVKTTNDGWTDTGTEGWEWRTETPFYIWFEAEAPANAPVIMVNGDSISIGTATSNPVQDSWVAIHARERGALPLLMSQHGSGMSWWGANSTRWDDMYPGVDVKPDAIISALGQNDLPTRDLEWQKTYYAALNDVYSTRWPGIPVYAASITPSNKAPELEVQRRDFNAWAKSAPHGERGYLDVAAPIATADDEDIKPEYAADHVHPNTAGMQAMATALNAYPVTSKAASDEALEKAVSVAARTLYGQGSPEGKITAPVGSMYMDSAATAGAVRWIKTSGTGSTGWRVEYGDTGGRRIFSQFSHLTTSTSSNLSIQRLGDSVELVVHAVAFDVDGVAAWSKIADLPAGFAPRTVFRQQLTLPSGTLEFRPDGQIRTTGTAIEKDAVVSFRVQWITPEPWPTSLPGLPV